MSQTVSDPQMAGISRARRLSEQLLASSMNPQNVRAGAGWSQIAPLVQALAGSLGRYQADSREDALNSQRQDEASAFTRALMGGAPPEPAAVPASPTPQPQPPAGTPTGVPAQAPPQPPPPNIYGRNQDRVAQRDALLDGDPVRLAAATEANLPAGQPAFNPARPGANSEMPGWDAGVAPPTGRVMPVGAPAATPLANSLGGAPAPTTPLASRLTVPAPERLMAAYGAAAASQNPLIRAQAPMLLQMAQFGALREDRNTDNTRQAERDIADRQFRERSLQLQAQGLSQQQAHQQALLEIQQRRLALDAATAGIPAGFEVDPAGGPGALRPRRGGPSDPTRTGMPYQGQSIEAQDSNILLRGDPASPEYAAAFARQSTPRVNADGSSVTPNMQAYRPPTYRPPSAAENGPAPDYGRPVVTEPTRPTVDQSRVGTYLSRMQEAERVFSNPTIAASAQDLGNRAADRIPLFGNYLTSSNYQQMAQAQRDFINAVLRRESGAVISDSEFANARQQYFPQPGDSPEVLRQKAQNRATLLAGFAREAGPASTPSASQSAAPPSAAPAPPPGFQVVR